MFLIFINLTLSSVHASEEGLHQTVKDLRSQVELLTARLLQMEKRLDDKESESGKNKQIIKVETKKVEVGDVKGSFKIPGTETSLAIGGYIKLDAIYNSQSAGGSGGSNVGDQMLLPGTIPVQSDDQEDDQVTFHARQSRFWMKSHTASDWGDLNTYLEMDFFAFQAPGNERVSNSYSPRLRHAFGSLGPFLAGQTWTTFMNVSALPELNDFGGPVGRIFARQPQLRWTQSIKDQQADWMIAIESPESTLTNINGDRETPNDDHFPDIITRLNLYRPWGSVSLAGMVRNIRSDSEKNSDAYGGALSLAGRVKAVDRDDLRFMLNYGNVLGRYASSNLFNDGAINSRGEVELFNQYGGFVAYRHWWHNNWRSTFAYGFSYADNVDFVADTVSQWAQSAQMNLLWSPLSQTTFGLEYSYASRGLENNESGHLHRIQFSSIFSF
ncbi:MAG: porin [Methylococcaceae bacterium]|nr:porin [Methylococcaceae bacterium]